MTTPWRPTRLLDIWPPPNYLAWPRPGHKHERSRYRYVVDTSFGYQGFAEGSTSAGITGDVFLVDTLDGETIEHREIRREADAIVMVARLIERARELNARGLEE